MSLTAQQKRDKEARIQARKEIRDQKKKEVREEKRLNKAKDSLRQRWEENGWKISEEKHFEDIKNLNYYFIATKILHSFKYFICIRGSVFNDGKVDVGMVSFSQNLKNFETKTTDNISVPRELRNPELGLSYEQYRRTEKMLKEKYNEMNCTEDEEVERVEHIISKVEDPEYRHGKHKKYHKELLRELNKTLDSTKKQVKNKKNNDNKKVEE